MTVFWHKYSNRIRKELFKWSEIWHEHRPIYGTDSWLRKFGGPWHKKRGLLGSEKSSSIVAGGFSHFWASRSPLRQKWHIPNCSSPESIEGCNSSVALKLSELRRPVEVDSRRPPYLLVYYTRTAGAYGPLVLAPFFPFFILFFLLFLFFKLFYFFLYFLPHILPHILPQILPQTTTSIAIHPPQCFLYLRETQANVLRGHSPPQKSSQATILE